ncbi:MAG: DUF4835 family protein [Alloprevotella sp.]|nr:DUF4835 family protein [Alloprevotella sp.]
MRKIRCVALLILSILARTAALAQELDCTVTINHQQVQGTSTQIFENLEKNLTALLNERRWTEHQYARHERIRCQMNISVTKYTESENRMECRLTVQSQRPVFDTNYTTTVWSMVDPNFTFTFQEYDKLEFRPDVITDDLTAMVGFYAYLIIGMDLDTMSPLGGTEVLQTALNVCQNAQNLTTSAKGWKPFDSNKNRYAIINDYLDAAMTPYRQMQYKYHREGLDVMAENPDRGRAAITQAIDLLAEAHQAKALSMLPQIFTEYKRDELVGIYQGKGSPKDKEHIGEVLSSINASQSNYWNKLKR